MREMLRDLEEAGGDRVRLARANLNRLQQQNLISPLEGRHLNRIVDVVNSSDSPCTIVAKVARIHGELTDSSGVSPVANMIGSIALNSVQSQLSVTAQAPEKNVAKADVFGCIGGAGAGGKFGVWGAVIGGVIGGTAASVAEAWGTPAPPVPGG